MKTTTIFQKTAVIFAMFVFIVFAFNACSNDDDDDPSDPTSVNVTKITVTDFPQHNGYIDFIVYTTPIYWDPLDLGAPDIFPSIIKGSKTIISFAGEYSKNAQNNSSYAFNVNPIVKLNPTDTYTIRLHDWDSAADDLMGETSFKPYNGDDEPNQLLITGGGVSWTLDVTYSH